MSREIIRIPLGQLQTAELVIKRLALRTVV